MPEIRSEQDGAEQIPSDTTQDMPQTHDSPRNDSHEPLWGMFLIASMILFVVASIAGIGWVAYTNWQSARVEKNQPSITALQRQPNEQEAAPAESPTSENPQAVNTDTQEQTASSVALAAKKLDISVLNGGAAKGSAGILAEFLKTEGYSKTVAGNTLKDYTGTVVYYAANLEKEAEVVKESVVKKYSQAKILPADANNKETSVSQVTVIIGK
ncbi:MAG: LytR C-terminal domain-containing protein [Candidatus Moraniibacteriota bacterium]